MHSVRLLCNQQTAALSHTEPIAVQSVCWQQACHARPYSQPAQDDQQQQSDEDASEKVKQLAADIMSLSVLECSQLSRVLRDKLGVPRGSGMPMMGMPMMAAGAPAAAAAAPAAADAPEAKKEKTEFDVKLEGFSPEGKIKVIKEIRALTNLGLKEAKELVGWHCNGCASLQLHSTAKQLVVKCCGGSAKREYVWL